MIRSTIDLYNVWAKIKNKLFKKKLIINIQDQLIGFYYQKDVYHQYMKLLHLLKTNVLWVITLVKSFLKLLLI